MIAASNVSRVSWPSGCLDQAAVDEVVAAGDVGGPAGGQERDQRGDLFWSSEPAGGEAADPGDDRLAGGIGVYSGAPGHRPAPPLPPHPHALRPPAAGPAPSPR